MCILCKAFDGNFICIVKYLTLGSARCANLTGQTSNDAKAGSGTATDVHRHIRLRQEDIRKGGITGL